MNGWERFEGLARQARRETPPPLDVASRVIRQIRAAPPAEELGVLAIMAGVSLAAASLVAVLAFQAWSTLSVPLSGLLGPLTLVLQ